MYDNFLSSIGSGLPAMGRAFQSGIASYSHSAGDNAKALGGSNV
jgi:hypothetical protein